MKIVLITVGKTQDREVAAAIADYSARIGHYCTFETIETSDDKLAAVMDRFDRALLLDEKGHEYDSAGFAELLAKQQRAGISSLAFVVGGPYGFTYEIRAKADGSVALSAMTFPHQLVRVIFLEQLYRAFTILRNEKYHHAG